MTIHNEFGSSHGHNLLDASCKNSSRIPCSRQSTFCHDGLLLCRAQRQKLPAFVLVDVLSFQEFVRVHGKHINVTTISKDYRLIELLNCDLSFLWGTVSDAG